MPQYLLEVFFSNSDFNDTFTPATLRSSLWQGYDRVKILLFPHLPSQKLGITRLQMLQLLQLLLRFKSFTEARNTIDNLLRRRLFNLFGANFTDSIKKTVTVIRPPCRNLKVKCFRCYIYPTYSFSGVAARPRGSKWPFPKFFWEAGNNRAKILQYIYTP